MRVCLLASSQAGTAGDRGPMEQIRGAGIWAGHWAGRGAVPILAGSANVCVLVTLEYVACVPSLVNLS